jgi:type VI secretion system secreted protein Hcp
MAIDMFMKLDDIKGESQDATHKGEIDVLSWNWGATQAGSAQVGGGTGSGKVQIQDLTFTKYTDRASPVLLGMCASGKPVKTALLTIRKAGSTPLEYVKITMSGAIITTHTHGCDAGGDRHTETVSLNFSSVKYEYTPQKADGSGDAVVTTGWDCAANKPL